MKEWLCANLPALKIFDGEKVNRESEETDSAPRRSRIVEDDDALYFLSFQCIVLFSFPSGSDEEEFISSAKPIASRPLPKPSIEEDLADLDLKSKSQPKLKKKLPKTNAKPDFSTPSPSGWGKDDKVRILFNLFVTHLSLPMRILIHYG